MLKNYNYILTIMLYPFILVLSYFLLSNKLEGSAYLYLLLIMIAIFIPSFIMSLYSALDEIIHSKKRWRLIWLILFSLFYLPIYYTKYVSKQEMYLGVTIPLISIVFSVLVFDESMKSLRKVFDSIYENKVTININYTYVSTNGLIRIDVDKSFICEDNIGDYIVSCDRLEDDSFIGIYYYDITDYSEDKIEDIFEYHLDSIIESIEEAGYSYETKSNDEIIKIYYEDMVILLSQNNYIVGDGKYSLIIMKEAPKELIDEKEYKKMIESVTFLNYNNGVSS